MNRGLLLPGGPSAPPSQKNQFFIYCAILMKFETTFSYVQDQEHRATFIISHILVRVNSVGECLGLLTQNSYNLSYTSIQRPRSISVQKELGAIKQNKNKNTGSIGNICGSLSQTPLYQRTCTPSFIEFDALTLIFKCLMFHQQKSKEILMQTRLKMQKIKIRIHIKRPKEGLQLIRKKSDVSKHVKTTR